MEVNTETQKLLNFSVKNQLISSKIFFNYTVSEVLI